MIKRVGWLFISILFAAFIYAPASTADIQPKNKGLFIAPLREYVDARPGQAKNGTLTIANITDKPITVTLSAEQFSVVDYTYDYLFTEAKEDWIKFQATRLSLQPNKSQTVSYVVAVPANATPGGHYFTLFATTSLHDGVTIATVRAAMVLYATVDGQLRRTSEIQKETIPWISFGTNIPFALDIKNTGNTHFFAYVSGKLIGPFVKPEIKKEAHILLPGTVRTIESTIAPPLLPGIYQAVYGYKTDDSQVTNRSRYIVYLPPWAIVIPVGLVWFAILVARRRKRISKKQDAIDSSQPRRT